jgi:hypothetical protein
LQFEFEPAGAFITFQIGSFGILEGIFNKTPVPRFVKAEQWRTGKDLEVSTNSGADAFPYEFMEHDTPTIKPSTVLYKSNT